MLGEGGTPLSKLQAAVREFQSRDARRVDSKGLRAVTDALKDELATYSPAKPEGGETEVDE